MLWRSIYIRFFLITVCSMLLVVGGLSYVSFRSARAMITREVTDSLGGQAKQTARNLSTALDSWSTSARLVAETLKDLRPKQWNAAAQRIFAGSREYLGFAVVRVAANGRVSPVFRAEAPSFLTDARYGLGGLGRIRAAINKKERTWAGLLTAELIANEKQGPPPLQFLTVTTDLAPTIVVVAIPAGEPAKNGDRDWAMVSVWDTLTANLLGEGQQGYLLTDRGKVALSSPNADSTSRRFKSLVAVVTAAVAAKDRSGTQWYPESDGNATVVAFAAVPKTKLYLMLERRGDLSSMAADSSLTDLALWSWAGLLACIMLSYLGATGISQNIRDVAETTRRIASGDLAYRYQPRGQDEVSWLGRAVNHMASELQRLLIDQQQKARIDAELGAAQILQNALLPPMFIAPEGVRISGRVESASECGGDWWGRFELPGGLELLCVADVTGHGVSASLVTGMICSFITSAAFRARKKPNEQVSPAVILNDINQLLYEVGKGRLTATAVLAVVNRQTGDVLLANGGHNPPLLLAQQSPEGETRVSSSKCRSLFGGANMLGLFPESLNCREIRASMGPGDKLVLYTDGLIERLARGGRGTGLRDLRATLHANRPLDAQGMMRAVIERAMSTDQQALLDDVTVVVLEFLGTRADQKSGAA